MFISAVNSPLAFSLVSGMEQRCVGTHLVPGVPEPRRLHSLLVSPYEDAHHCFGPPVVSVQRYRQIFLVGPVWVSVLLYASNFSSDNNNFALGSMHLGN